MAGVDVRLVGPKLMNLIISHLEHVVHEVHGEAKKIGHKAEANLAAARASTKHVKLDQSTAHQTNVSVEHHPGSTDSFVFLDGPDAVALEYGHAPSGAFGPGGKYGITRAPAGLYILNRAAGFEGKQVTPSLTRRRGKR